MESREQRSAPRTRRRVGGALLAAILPIVLMATVLAPSAFAAIGDHIWSSAYQWGRGAAIDDSGNITTYGVFFGTTDFGGGPLTAQNHLTGDVFLAHFDAQGNHLWSQQFTPVGGNGLFSFVIAADGAGNIYVAGRLVLGTLDFGGGPLDGSLTLQGQGVLACFDSAGNHQWSFGFGNGTALNLVATDTRLVGVGELNEGPGVDLGGGALVSAGQVDAFVFELSPSGAHRWSQRFGDTDRQAAEALSIDALGNVLIAGAMFGTADFGGGPVTATGIEYYIAKFDPTGTHLWNRSLTGTVASTAPIRHGLDLATGPSGEVLLGGRYRDDIDLGGGSVSANGFDDIFVASYDGNGTYQWELVFGNTSFDEATSVDVDSGGNVVVAGKFWGDVDLGGGLLPFVGVSGNPFLAIYDPAGSHQFSAAFGTGTEIYARFDRSNDIFLYGAGSTIDFGGGPINNSAFLVKLDGTLNTPVGSDIPVVPVDGTTGSAPVVMTFEDVSSAGSTTLTTSTAGPPPPSSLSFGDMTTYYDISTSAGFVGTIEICVEYDEATIPGAESDLTLQHYDAAIPGWVDVTSSLDEANNILCGVTTSLSPFALAVPATSVGVEQDPPGPQGLPRPDAFALAGNAPNPFNPSTVIAYDVPAGGGRVTVDVYDAAGRLVRALVGEYQSAGRKTVRWDGRDHAGSRVATGVYFYRMRARNFTATRKMALVE